MPDLETAPAIEAPVIDTPETTEVIEQPIESTEGESPVEESTAPDSASADAKEDGRQFAGKLRDHYKELMDSKDPAKVQLAKAVKDLFFQNKALRDKFPGGVKEVEEKLAAFDKFGAPEQLEALQADAKVLEDIDNKWQAADPAFIDELAALNADSFKKLMPVGLNKFAQVDPEGYKQVMSGIIHQTLESAGLSNVLYNISRALTPRYEGDRPDVAEAMRLLKDIAEWKDGLGTAAKAPAPTTPAANPELDQRAAALEEREAEFFNTQLRNEVVSWRDSQIKSTLNKLTSGAKVDPERYEIFQERVVRELAKMHAADFEDKWTRLYAQGDKAALVKFLQGVDGTNMQKAVAKVHTLLFPSNGVKKAPVATPAAPPTAKPAEAGWVKIAQRPNPQDIDRGRNRTTDEMIFSGKAILRDGKRVTWDRA